jgi:hypothetical protein
MTHGHTFDSLYHQLAPARDAHRSLRMDHPSLTALAESSLRLERGRLAMWDWNARHTAVIG